MKKPIFSKIINVLRSEKFVAVLILLGGFSVVFLVSHFSGSFAYDSVNSEAKKEIVDQQNVPDSPTEGLVEEEIACYDCGSGSVLGLGTSKENCAGKLSKNNGLICTSTSFTETEEKDSGEIGSIVTVPRLCELSVYEITYPVYWNGHNKYVDGSYDNRYNLYEGEWPDASKYVYGGTVVGVKDGVPIVEGNNYASIYEPPDISISGSSDGSSRAGLKYTLGLGGNVHDKENAGEYHEFYTPDCQSSAPGSTLIGNKSCVSQDWSINTIHQGVLDGNDPLLLPYSEVESELYPEIHPDCSSFPYLTKVIEDRDKACINDDLFKTWKGIWDIVIKISEGCLLDGTCRGSTTGTVTIIMDHISYAGRLITIDSRMNPGNKTKLRYVETPGKVEKICLGSKEYLDATIVWPDYLYPTWLSSEYGSSVCDPEKNYASVITEDGSIATFNFCEYDGSLGYFSYVQYVTKRCDCVINEGCKPISDDEKKSCSMMINGKF